MKRLLLCSALCAGAGWAWQWDSPDVGGSSQPGARRGHSLTTFVQRGHSPSLIVCGGEEDSLYISNKCSVLNPFTWSFDSSFSLAVPRQEHIAVQGRSSSDDYLIVAGGAANASAAFCEVLRFPDWQPAPGGGCNGTLPTATWGSSVTTTSKGVVVVFAGSTGTPGDPGADTDEVRVLEGAPMVTWRTPALTAGTKPAARHYHAAAAWGTTVVVFGGITTAGQILSDVWTLETDGTEWLWLQAAATGAPALFGHKAIVTGSLLVVFGGQDRSGSSALWSAPASKGDTWAFSTPSVDGAAPPAILRSALVLLDADGDSDPDMIVYGGSAGTSTVPTSYLTVLSEIGRYAQPLQAELPLIIGGVAGAFVLLFGLGVCAWRRKARPAGLASMLAAMSANPAEYNSYSSYDHSGEEEEQAGKGGRGGRDDVEDPAALRQPLTHASPSRQASRQGLAKQGTGVGLRSPQRGASAMLSPSRGTSAVGLGLVGLGTAGRSTSRMGMGLPVDAPLASAAEEGGRDAEGLDGDDEDGMDSEEDEERMVRERSLRF